MQYDSNPFEVLYVTDSADPSLFVQLFSDLPIRFSGPIFQPGNVILKGTQGCGKSMLLNLLKPQIRLAYHDASIDFPVTKKSRGFVGAGINLTLSGALDIGQRPVAETKHEDEALFPLLFADFLNYFVARDLLRSIQVMANRPDAFDDLVNSSRLDSFAVQLASQDCWFGTLDSCKSVDDLCRVFDGRIAEYRSFHQFNCELSEKIATTKTNIGEPIARIEETLKSCEVIGESVPVIIRIDQLEKLYRSDVLRKDLGIQYRRVVNKALSKRDSRVSYRIGTRPYAWDDDRTVYGTDDQLESVRDFRVVDLDGMFRRKENQETWVFPEFAEDAFRRRLPQSDVSNPLKAVFGGRRSASDRARDYAQNPRVDYVLQLESSWPETWRSFLTKLFNDDPFSGKLAAAWVRQQGQQVEELDRLDTEPPTRKPYPWAKETWKRDRIRQCLLQIAARCAQRQKWSGTKTIQALSAPNISVFLSVCHEIWDAFLRSEVRKSPDERVDPVNFGIDPNVQTVGIETASKHWYTKISELPGGHDRMRFVDVLGRFFRSQLLDDVAMTYPGRNGFSLKVDELKRYPPLEKFLNDASDYGDLVAIDHTTKDKNRRQRMKWYLNPILSPFFQIPEQHKKEPYYATIEDVAGWLQEAEVVLPDFVPPKPRRNSNRPAEGQKELFPDADGGAP